MSRLRSLLPRRLSDRILAICGVLAVMAVVGLVLSDNGGSPAAGVAAPQSQPQQALAPAPSPTVAPNPPGVTTVATVLHGSAGYSSPGVRGSGSVPATWYGRPSVLPVIGSVPGWVRVRLAQRPNGSTTWLPDKDVQLSTTPYRIVIDRASTDLQLYQNGRLVLSAPAGIGAVSDPTPPGQYFVAFREPPPGPGYGPFVLVTSAHSQNISDWDGSGDAVIGIHGPLGEDAQIGTRGARISHGCIRLHLASLAHLDEIPAGTPIEVTE